MSDATKRGLKVAVSLGLAVALLAVFARSLKWSDVAAALRGAHLGWLLLATVAGLLATPPIRSWRWGRLLSEVGPVSARHLNSATAIGFAASTLLPARAGEIVRPVALSRSANVPLAPALASIGLERLLDLISAIALFAVYAAGWAPRGLGGAEAANFALLRRSAFTLAAATAVGLSILVLLALRPALAERVLGPLERRLPRGLGSKVVSFLRSFLAGLGALRTPARVLEIAALSALLWLVICVQIYATLRAFDLAFPFPVTFFCLTWGILGLAIPTPGGVGGYHAAISYALTGYYGVAPGTAAAFALVSHAISFVPITLLGLLVLAASGLSLGRLAETPAEATEAGEGARAG